jgi:hypothetical protein
VTEVEFEQAVVDLAHTFGWKVAGFRPARTKQGWRTPVKYDGKGWPDLTLVHAERRIIIFAELKADRGRRSDEQDAWADTLEAACNDIRTMYRLWRPDDFPAIAALLSNNRVTQASLR